MKKTNRTGLVAFILLAFICIAKSFAQAPVQEVKKTTNPFSFITVIKLDEVAGKEDMDKVREVLRSFGYKVHSHKINFEHKEVIIRMRQQVSNDSLINAFKLAGYTAWHDEKETIRPGDAVYRGDKK